jgi:hypothetical protein
MDKKHICNKIVHVNGKELTCHAKALTIRGSAGPDVSGSSVVNVSLTFVEKNFTALGWMTTVQARLALLPFV